MLHYYQIFVVRLLRLAEAPGFAPGKKGSEPFGMLFTYASIIGVKAVRLLVSYPHALYCPSFFSALLNLSSRLLALGWKGVVTGGEELPRLSERVFERT